MKITLKQLRQLIKEEIDTCPCGIARQDCEYHRQVVSAKPVTDHKLERQLEKLRYKLNVQISKRLNRCKIHRLTNGQMKVFDGVTVEKISDDNFGTYKLDGTVDATLNDVFEKWLDMSWPERKDLIKQIDELEKITGM